MSYRRQSRNRRGSGDRRWRTSQEVRSEHLAMFASAPTGLPFLKQRGRLVAHKIGGLDVDVGACDRKLNALVLADRPLEHHAFTRVPAGALDEPVPVADALGGDQDALRVHAVQDVAETLTLVADQVLGRHFEIVEEHLVGLVVGMLGSAAP